MISFKIDYPKTPEGKREWNRRYGLNAYYSGKHPAVRTKDARYWHELTAVYLAKAKVRKDPFTKPVKITFYWNDNLDLDNHSAMGKMILDGLKGRLIHDDSRKWVKSIEHTWHDEDCIRVCLSEATMPNLTDTFNPELCEEMTGYTFRDMIAMYEDYERMASELEAIRNIGEYQRGWQQGRNDTMRAYGIKEC